LYEPISPLKDLESDSLEGISYELSLSKRKWGILCLYRQPSMKDNILEHYIIKSLDNLYINFDHMICIRDLNYDMLKKDESKCISNICDSFNLFSKRTNMLYKKTFAYFNWCNTYKFNIAKHIGIEENEQDTYTHLSKDKINSNRPQSQQFG
jgi:hypothetical protein